MTWSNDDRVVEDIVAMMMGSWEALVSYQTPLGVAHQFTSSDHYGPNPAQWFQQDDWSPVYYNKADSAGLGFDRSAGGSNFVAQYFPTLEERYGDIDTVPENLMMWFHHVPWDHRMSSGRPFWDELVHRYQMGVQYVTWMRETWDSLEPHIGARRFQEVKAKLATHEADAANWRDTSVNYWREFSGREVPVDDGPLSARIVVDGEEIGGFDLSAASYTIPVAAGASPRITEVRTADPAARHEIVSQAHGVPGRAVVKVTKDEFFGPIVKNYVFDMVPDTTLQSLAVGGRQLASFEPDDFSYNAVLEPGAGSIAQVEAVASDPAAAVSVEQATSPTGQAKVTVTSGGASSVYTVDLDTRITGSDEFDSAALGSQWEWLRPDDGSWRLADGSLVITAQPGDLQGNVNTAKNVALQDVNGDWTRGVEAGLLAAARGQQRAGRDRGVRRRRQLREARVGDGQRERADQQAARRLHARAERRADHAAGHRLRRAAHRRRRRRHLAAGSRRRGAPTGPTTPTTAPSTGSWEPRR